MLEWPKRLDPESQAHIIDAIIHCGGVDERVGEECCHSRTRPVITTGVNLLDNHRRSPGELPLIDVVTWTVYLFSHHLYVVASFGVGPSVKCLHAVFVQ